MKILPFSLKTSNKTKSDKWLNKASYRLVPVVGLEPTRGISPTDFESVTSANSITPANYVLSDTARTIMLVYIIPHCG